MEAVLEQVHEMDASEFHAERLNVKEMILHKWWNRIPIADGTENFFRGYQDLRSPPWQGFIQDRGEVQHDLLGESDGFPPTTKAWNRCASPQNIQWSATTSPTAKNCREVLWQNWARTTSTSRLTIWQYRRDKVSKHILKGSWKYRDTCRQGKFDTFCFFFFWRHVAGRELIRTVDKFSMSLSPSTFESPGTLSRHLQLWTVRMRRKAQGYSKHQVDRLEVQGNLTQEEEEIPIPTQFSRMAKGCSTGWTSRATCRDRKKDQEPLELSGDWRCRETCRTKIRRISRKPRTSRKIRRLGNRRQNLAASFPCITRLCTSHGESLLDRKTDLWSKSYGWSERPRCEHSYRVFLKSVTLQAAVHLGQDYTGHLRSIKNQPFKSVRQLFQTTERLITDQMEITGLSTIDWKQPMWRETTLLCDRAVQIANSKTYVFSDSVLCLGNISVKPVESWEDRIKWFLETRYLKDLDRIDGDPMEFEGTFFPGFTTLGILAEIQKIMTESKCEPEQVKGRIIFLSMYTDIVWRQRGNRGNCVAKTFNVAAYANKFTRSDGGQFWDLIVRKIGMELSNRVAESMMINFAESGHPMFQATSALGRGEMKSEGGGKKTIHNNGSEGTVELILRTVISVNQLSIYGAVADLCNRLAKVSPSAGKPAGICQFKKSNWRWDLRILGDTDWDCQCKKHRISELNIIGTGRLVARIRTEIRRTSWWSEIVETMLRRWFLKGNWQRTILNYT